jgi:hypothetical protein
MICRVALRISIKIEGLLCSPSLALLYGLLMASRPPPVLMLADCQTQRCRRAFPEHFPILNRKSPEFTKAKTGRDFADGHGRTIGRH